MKTSRLFVSVDVDPWYFARWATGSVHSRWPSPEACVQEVYGTTDIDTLSRPLNWILELFDSLNFKSTFFFTGYIAEKNPHLVKQVAGNGHEVACHNYFHIDYKGVARDRFIRDLQRAVGILEDLTGKAVKGYRSPNSSVPDYLVEILESFGFAYDSSVTPTRAWMGKWGDFTTAPRKPYHPAIENIAIEGNAKLWELPWAVFPGLHLPAGSGIMHRIAGDWYNHIALSCSLKKGHTAYYFHPYELQPPPSIPGGMPLKARIFFRNCGEAYREKIRKLLTAHRDRLINGIQLVALCRQEQENTMA